MILNTQTQNIKVITFQYHAIWNKLKEIKNNKVPLDQFLIIEDAGYQYNTNYNVTVSAIENAKYIYLGNKEDIIQECVNNKCHIPFNELSTIYIDPLCKFPRSRIKEVTKLKRVLDPSKADTCILPDPKYNLTPLITNRYTSGDFIILYSSTTNCYYIIESLIRNPYYCKETADTIYTMIGCSSDEEFIPSLLNWLKKINYVSSDSAVIYKGSTICIANSDEIRVFELMTSGNVSFYYLSEFSNYVDNNLEEMTPENFDTITQLIRSNNEDNINLGLSLLQSLDISKYHLKVVKLLRNRWYSIKYTKTCNTVGFVQLLSKFGLDKSDMNYGTMEILYNKLYLHASDDDSKKEIRDICINDCKQQLQNVITNCSRLYKDMNISVSIQINE